MADSARVFAGRTIAPMKASPGALDVGDDVGADVAVEMKWDGMRAVSFVDAAGVRLQSTNLLDVTVSFPELDALAAAFADFGPVILDGEVVAVGADGQPSFPLLQGRMHIKDRAEAQRRARSVPVSYVIFDLLHLDGTDVMHLAWRDRRRLLEQILESPGETWRINPAHSGDEFGVLLDFVAAQGLEGLVVKERGSRYEPGRRGRSWVKIKPRRRQEFVVGGWLSGDGLRSDTIGSLLVGYHDDEGNLRFAGRVGSGLSQEDLAAWMARVTSNAVARSPFVDDVPPKAGRTVGWCEPIFVVEVAFASWGQPPDAQLRHPSYLGLRTDKDPTTVVRES